MAHRVLILGGARSGKSGFASELAGRIGRVLFVATASPDDSEMAERIARHRTSRPPDWRTVEVNIGVAGQISGALKDVDVVLLDCVTLLASNILLKEDEPAESLREELDAIFQVCSDVHLILVSNEVGMGLVPPYPLGRAFRDLLGWANRYMAEKADIVLFILAGIPLVLKGGDAYEGIMSKAGPCT